MKLSGAVLGALRGIGGAAVIVAAGVSGCISGCGAAPRSEVVVAPPPVSAQLVSTNDTVALQPKPGTDTVTYDPEPDYAVACGRG